MKYCVTSLSVHMGVKGPLFLLCKNKGHLQLRSFHSKFILELSCGYSSTTGYVHKIPHQQLVPPTLSFSPHTAILQHYQELRQTASEESLRKFLQAFEENHQQVRKLALTGLTVQRHHHAPLPGPIASRCGSRLTNCLPPTRNQGCL